VQRWRGLGSVPTGWGRCVTTIGVFDGVHRGHRTIIGRAVERARVAGLPGVLVTFEPHPSEVVRPGTHPAVLTTHRYRAELVEALGVDAYCVLPFTPEFSRLEPTAFVHAVLVEHLHAAAVVVGENFRYGRKAAGDVETLRADGARFGFSVEGVALFGEAETTYSSTYVRACVAAGNVEGAARALARDHRVEGVVVRGDRRGRELGYPTANVEPVPHSAVPADGVYAGRLLRWTPPDSAPRAGATDGADMGPPGTVTRLPAAISIGTNPTFSGQERRVEVHVVDPDSGPPPPLDLYGEHVGVEFVARLRDTLRFDSADALVQQMDVDVHATREALARDRR
jgi:riboflavin kinase/FMN adenylyltransferase